MSLEENTWVEIEYTGKYDDGKVFDSNVGKEPLKFKIGARMVIPGFENTVKEMSIDEEKEVAITPDQGYGERNEEVVELPKASFQDLSVLEVGKELQMMTNMGPLLVNVIEISDDKVKVKLNHPLAGKTLHFKIKLLAILSEEEAAKEDEKLQEMIKQAQEGLAHTHDHPHNQDNQQDHNHQ